MMNDKELAALLRSAKTIAVVGLSSNPARASFGVSRFLQRQGFRVIPINPNEMEVLGEKAYANLASVPVQIDIANVFRKPETVGEIVDDALAKGISTLWLQEGVVNPKEARRAEEAGMTVVMDRCILKELARLMS